MNFTQAVSSGFSKYVQFSGRAPRSEFWYWELFVFLGSIAAAILDFALLPGNTVLSSPLTTIFDLGTFLPGLAMSVRRLHDIDRSGWWLLIVLIPLVGVIVLIIWWCSRGTTGYNRFGADYFKPDGYAPKPRTA